MSCLFRKKIEELRGAYSTYIKNILIDLGRYDNMGVKCLTSKSERKLRALKPMWKDVAKVTLASTTC